jgi:hypothetical protein
MTYPYGAKGAPVVGNGLGGLPRRATTGPSGLQGLQYAERTVSVVGKCASNNYVFKGESGKSYGWPSLFGNGSSGLVQLGQYAQRSISTLNQAQNSNGSIYVQPTAGHANGFSVYAAYWQSFGNLPGTANYYNANGDVVDGVSISNGGNAENTVSAFSPDGTKAVIGYQYGPSSDNPNVAVDRCYYRFGVGIKKVVSTGYTLSVVGIAVNNTGKVAIALVNSDSAQLSVRIYNESTDNQDRSATFGNPSRRFITTASDGKFLIASDNTLWVYDPVTGSTSSTAMPGDCQGLYFTNSGHVLWAIQSTSSDPRNYSLRKYSYPAISLVGSYNNVLTSAYTYGTGLYFNEEPGTNRLAITNRYHGLYIFESDWATAVSTYGFGFAGQAVFAPFGGFSFFIETGYQSFRYEYAATYGDKVLLAGIALESVGAPSKDGVNIRMQTSGVKTISADFRSVGGIALITSGLTP